MLDPAPAFRLDLTAWALRRRKDNQTDLFDGGEYSRILSFADTPVEIFLSQKGVPNAPHIAVHVQGARLTKSVQSKIILTLEKVFGLRIDLSRFYAIAKHNPRLGLLVNRFLGLKPPRFPTIPRSIARSFDINPKIESAIRSSF